MTLTQASQISLLLLPSPPTPWTYVNLRTAYAHALSTTLVAVARAPNSTPWAAILEIALPCPDLKKYRNCPRSQAYPGCQRLLAGIYKLICVVCAEQDLEIEGQGGVDARVLLLTPDENDATEGKGINSDFVWHGPACDLPTLVCSERPWLAVFAVDHEEGNALANRFLELADRLLHASRPYWPIQKIAPGQGPPKTPMKTPAYDLQLEESGSGSRRHFDVAVGGTFDHLHAGHKLLLTMSAFLLDFPDMADQQSRRLIVGISADELLRNKRFAEYLSKWDERQADVSEFVRAITDFTALSKPSSAVESTTAGEKGKKVTARYMSGFILECVQITDPYGPTVTDDSITALVVSAETRDGGKAVNEKRAEKGWDPLDVFEVDVLDIQGEAKEEGKSRAAGFESKISSTEIRRRINQKEKARTHVE